MPLSVANLGTNRQPRKTNFTSWPWNMDWVAVDKVQTLALLTAIPFLRGALNLVSAHTSAAPLVLSGLYRNIPLLVVTRKLILRRTLTDPPLTEQSWRRPEVATMGVAQENFRCTKASRRSQDVCC